MDSLKRALTDISVPKSGHGDSSHPISGIRWGSKSVNEKK